MHKWENKVQPKLNTLQTDVEKHNIRSFAWPEQLIFFYQQCISIYRVNITKAASWEQKDNGLWFLRPWILNHLESCTWNTGRWWQWQPPAMDGMTGRGGSYVYCWLRHQKEKRKKTHMNWSSHDQSQRTIPNLQCWSKTCWAYRLCRSYQIYYGKKCPISLSK
jgi:hypothetical protein